MVFNGGKTRLDGQFDNFDFYELLQKYGDNTKLKDLESTEMVDA